MQCVQNVDLGWQKIVNQKKKRKFVFFHKYPLHYNLLLIWNRSWTQTVHEVWILRKKLLQITFLAFKNGVKSIQTADYNGTRAVFSYDQLKIQS